MEHARRKCANAEREEHVAELRHRRVREHALDVVLHQGDGGCENRSDCADDGHRLHGCGRKNKQSIRPRHHVHARRHHGCGMD